MKVKKKFRTKVSALLLVALMVFSVLPVEVFAANNEVAVSDVPKISDSALAEGNDTAFLKTDQEVSDNPKEESSMNENSSFFKEEKTAIKGFKDTRANPDSNFEFSAGTITKYKGPAGDVVVPDTIGGVAVTAIGDTAFNYARYRIKITSIVLPSGLKSIGNSAFYDQNIIKIDFPSGLESIGEDAFLNCHLLEEVILPDTVTIMGSGAFQQCESIKRAMLSSGLTKLPSNSFYPGPSAMPGALTDVVFKEGLEEIGSNAFYGQSLKNVRLPDSVRVIEREAFAVQDDPASHGDFYLSTDIQAIKSQNDNPSIGNAFSGWEGRIIFPITKAEAEARGADKILKKFKVFYAGVVSYETNGGNPATIVDETVLFEGLIQNMPAEPTKMGYDFSGWFSDIGLTASWDFATSKVTADTTLYAKWDAQEWAINFESNGGSIVPNQKVKTNEVITEPVASTKAGNTFIGWYSDIGLTTPWDFTTKVSADTTLYAKWKEHIFTVKYNTGYGGATISDKVNVKWNDSNLLPEPPKKAGYGFMGWELVDTTMTRASRRLITTTDKYSDLTTDQTDGSFINLTAKWVKLKDYSILYNTNGGSMPADIPSSITGMMYDDTVPTPTPIRDGYTFEGWTYKDTAVKDGSTYNALAKDDTIKQIELVAQWEMNKYTVDYKFVSEKNPDGISVPKAVNVEFGGVVDEPKFTELNNWIFDGWYLDKECTQKYDFNTPIKEDMTLYGKWTYKTSENQKPEEPTTPSTPDSGTDLPKTGDNMNLNLFVTLLGISASLLLLLVGKRKKQHDS